MYLILVQPLKVDMDLLILSFGELSETNMVSAVRPSSASNGICFLVCLLVFLFA